MQDLADHLKTFTNATAVYMGKLIQPNKPIGEDAIDNSHIDLDAEKVVCFAYSNKEHSFLVDKTLTKD